MASSPALFPALAVQLVATVHRESICISLNTLGFMFLITKDESLTLQPRQICDLPAPFCLRCFRVGVKLGFSRSQIECVHVITNPLKSFQQRK